MLKEITYVVGKSDHAAILKGNPSHAVMKERCLKVLSKAAVYLDGEPVEDAEKQAAVDVAEVILVTTPAPPEEQQAAAEAATDVVESGEAEEVPEEELSKRVNALVERKLALQPVRRIRHAIPDADIKIPVVARRYRAKNMRACRNEIDNPDLVAYKFGNWFAATAGADWAITRCNELGIPMVKAQSEGVNTAGGFLVPPEFESTIIDLKDEFGVFRQWSNIMPMSAEVKNIPRRTGGLTATFTGESVTGTQTDLSWDQVTLVARKLMTLTKSSNELNEDAIISIGDKIASEIAQAFANKEDLCGFTGDGSQTFGGIVGVGPRITNVNGVTEGGGVIVGTGNLPSELTLADFHKTIGILPQFADTPNAAWYCHRTVWATAMQRLQAAGGGNDIVTLENGARVPSFLGYPVRVTQTFSLPGTSDFSFVLAVLGDLSQAAMFGDRRGMTVATSDSALNAFEKDELVIRGTQRFDINVHDVGTATVAGPVVALVGKGS